MREAVSVVIPARNEATTVGSVVTAFRDHPLVREVIVIDSASNDTTGAQASEHGAHVIRIEEEGLGRALKVGLKIARSRWIFKVDGDMRNASGDWLSAHLDALDANVGMVKAYWDSSEDPMPVTNLVAKPAIQLLIPSLAFVHMPIAGVYLWDRSLFPEHCLPDDYSFDLEVLIRAHRSGRAIAQVHLGEVLDKLKPVRQYSGMAAELLRCITRQADVARCEPMMVVMAHPDDAEIWCGGTITKILNAGGIVELWILTGSPIRQREAISLAKIYSNLRIRFLAASEFSELRFDAITQLENAIIQLRPHVIVTHHYADGHPDHRQCFDLVTSACLRIDRKMLPRTIYLCNTYYQTPNGETFRPNVFIDISAEANLKYNFIGHHLSQDIAHWIRMARALDELNGAKCGVDKAEAFQTLNFYTTPASSEFL
jgi:glucosyl-3-phosphoglycerate synthase